MNNAKLKLTTLASLLAIMYLLGGFTQKLNAQPTEIHYGPKDINYKLPRVQGNIFYVSPEGEAKSDGLNIKHPTTLEVAVAKASSGDAIILRGGTYRTGSLVFNQGIIFQAYANEKPLLKGTYIADQWEETEEGLWTTSWTRLFPSGPEDWWHQEREEQFTPLHRFNDDMVFVDGRFLQSAGSKTELDTTNFYIDYEENKVYLAIDPASRLIEITAYNVALHCVYKDVNGKNSDGIGPKIRGINFSQYSDTTILIDGTYPHGPANEADFGKKIQGTLIENCEISWCSRQAAFVKGDNFTMRNCKISNTSREGLYIVASSDVLLEHNIFTKNNIENITGCYPAAVKIFNQCYRVKVSENLVTDLPNSNGVWYDVGNVDGVFVNNLVTNVGKSNVAKYPAWRNMSGFFFEISKGAICAGNVFIDCDNGSFVLNSSNVTLMRNTYVNSKAAFMRNERSAANDHFGWHPATGPDVHERTGHVFKNNLMVQNDTAHKMTLFETWQPKPLCNSLTTLQLEELDYNVYVRTVPVDSIPLIYWNALRNDTCDHTFDSPESLHELEPPFSAHSSYFKDYQKPVLTDPANGKYSIVKNFPGRRKGSELPENIKELLLYTEESNMVGAY